MAKKAVKRQGEMAFIFLHKGIPPDRLREPLQVFELMMASPRSEDDQTLSIQV